MSDTTLKLPRGLDTLLAGLCMDFFRREEALRAGTASFRVRMEYEYLNVRIFEAACEECHDGEEARLYIEEIGEKIGYASSRAACSETTYKQKKQRIRRNILKKLHLLDDGEEKIFPRVSK